MDNESRHASADTRAPFGNTPLIFKGTSKNLVLDDTSTPNMVLAAALGITSTGLLVTLAAVLLAACYWRLATRRPRARGVPLANGALPLVGHLLRLKKMREAGMETHDIFYKVCGRMPQS